VTVIVNIDTTPAPTGPVTQFSCGGILWDLNVTGSDIKWYSSAAGNAPIDSYTQIEDGGHYFASQTVDACESSDRLEIVTEAQPSTPAPEPPPILGDWESISSQPWASHNIGIKIDGTLWGWGDNAHGQLGNGTSGDTLAYATVLNTDKWKAIETGRTHTVGIKSDGTLWVWGNELATDAGGTDRTIPMKISAATDWSTLSAGGYHTLAIKTDGTLWAWGLNNYGQLGDGTKINRSTPVRVGTGSNWKYISAGLEDSYAIKADGTLWGWGDDPSAIMNIYGDDQLVPVRLRETDNNWKLISAGINHCLGVKNDGTLWAMGVFVGYTPTSNYGPVRIGDGTDWKTVSTGAEHAVGVKTDGTLWAVWGRNAAGELGEGPLYVLGFSTIPKQIGNASDWQTTEVGHFRSLLMKTDGSMWALGLNNFGQLSVLPEVDYYSTDEHYIRVPRLVQSVNLFSNCQPRTIADLRVTGSQIKWYADLEGGSPLPATTPVVHGKHYYASQTIGQCESPYRLKVTELNMDGAAAVGSTTQSFCTPSTIADLIAFAAELKWYDAPIGGTLLSPSAPLVNDTHYYGAQIFDGCESISRLDVKVLVNENPTTNPTGNAIQSICEGATIEQLIVSGTNIQWYEQSTGGTPLANTTVLVGDKSYFATQTSNECESTTRLMVTVNVNPRPPAPTGNVEQFFEPGSKVGDIVVNGRQVKWYASVLDAQAGTNALTAAHVLDNDNTYFATQTWSDCESDALAVKVSLIITGIEPDSQALEFYPNPVVDLLKIASGKRMDNIAVYSAVGKQVMIKDINDTYTEIDLSLLGNGVYFVQIRFGNKAVSRKVIKL
jgi:alpha-tubulin suppressor-like RCC1 family protein